MNKVALIRLPSSAMLYLASVVMILSLLDLDLAAAADELDTQEDTMATGMTDDDESAMGKYFSLSPYPMSCLIDNVAGDKLIIQILVFVFTCW